MRILILTPTPPGSNRGNQITADRWKALLEDSGHQVAIDMKFDPIHKPDCLITLHAKHSWPNIQSCRAILPDCPIVLCLTGTDLHIDFQPGTKNHHSNETRENHEAVLKSLALSDAIVGLEPIGLSKIPRQFQDRCYVILQSALPFLPKPPKHPKRFTITVLGHLRSVKDPFRTAKAVRLLPSRSNIFVEQMGEALSEQMCRLAEQEANSNDRYHWLGNLPHHLAMKHLAASQLMVLSSFHEGAPSVLSEAIVNRIPIVASKIDATIGLLGSDYPGFFEAGDTRSLANQIATAEKDPGYLDTLNEWTEPLLPKLTPAFEKASWQNLLEEITGT